MLLLWCLALYEGYVKGPHLLQALNPKIEPPKDSQSYVAIEQYAKHLMQFARETNPFSTVIVIRGLGDPAKTVDDSSAVERFSRLLNSTFRCQLDSILHKHCDTKTPWRWTVHEYEGYFLEQNEKVRELRKGLYVNPEGTATQIIMKHEAKFLGESDLSLFYQDLSDFVDQQLYLEGYSVTFVSEPQLLNIAKEQANYDFEHADMIGIPFAWIILYWYCGLPALLVLVTLPTSILFSFAVNDHFIPGELPQFAPSLIVSIGVALNIDYALFILVRYTDELRKQPRGTHSPNTALDNALNTAGRTVAVSGQSCL